MRKVDLPFESKPLVYKLIFKIKIKVDNTINKYKIGINYCILIIFLVYKVYIFFSLV